MEKQISLTHGDAEGLIDDLIKYLNLAKGNGATHYKMWWSGDSGWAFKWFELYRIKSEEEINQEKIAALEKELNDLKNNK